LSTQAVHRWGAEIHEGIYDMLHLLLNLIASRLKYKPVPFGLLDMLTQVIVDNFTAAYISGLFLLLLLRTRNQFKCNFLDN